MATSHEALDIRQEPDHVGHQVPQPPLTPDCIQENLREAYAAVERYRHDIRIYAESLSNFYQNWANQYLRHCHRQLQDVQQVNTALQGLQETLLSENTILHLELEQFKKSPECQQGLSQPEKRISSMDDTELEGKSSETTGAPKLQVKRRRRPTRGNPKERQPPPLLAEMAQVGELRAEERLETKMQTKDHISSLK